jgi:16S rRNA (cytosine967-C5)-methyltransferase
VRDSPPPGGARAAAVRALERTLDSLAPADHFLAREARGLDERDRKLAAELVYGALRWKLRLEYVVERASGRRISAIDPELRAVLSVGVLQLLFLDRVPAHAAVDEAVAEAKRRRGPGAGGFVNAVLRRIASAGGLGAWPVETASDDERLAIETSHPPELVRRWRARFGDEATRRALAADNSSRALHLLAFTDRGGRGALAAALAAEGIVTEPGQLAPGALIVRSGAPLASAAFARGDGYVQDEASQAAALVPRPRPGERILDAAAAPGGKGLAILAFEPSARVVFADAAPRRLPRLVANGRRLGRRLAIVAADGRRPPWRDGAFDRVVVDAPCSGTGTLRRHPELRWRFRASELERLARDAGALLVALAPAVVPGGLLVHVTCSVEAEENEQVLDRFVAANPAFEPLELDVADPWIASGRTAPGRWRVLPGAGHDGFSVGVLRRRT